MPPSTPTEVALPGRTTLTPLAHWPFVSVTTTAWYWFEASRYAPLARQFPTAGQAIATTPPFFPADSAPLGRASSCAPPHVPLVWLARNPSYSPLLASYCPPTLQLPLEAQAIPPKP